MEDKHGNLDKLQQKLFDMCTGLLQNRLDKLDVQGQTGFILFRWLRLKMILRKVKVLRECLGVKS